jgi:threonine dehydratase
MFTLDDIRQARELVSPYVRRTRLERNDTLSQALRTNVYLKLEVFQKTGSFKPRGAFNQILRVPEAQRANGIVAVSGGNFAQGVAYAANRLGVRALICMAESTPKNYVEATQSYGAEVQFAASIAEAFALAKSHQENGMASVHPYDNPHQMAGAGTAGLEIVEDLPEMTDVIISIGGGGLIGGVSHAVKSLKPAVRVWGVETEGADTMGQALKAGKVVHMTPTSLAKTLGAPYVAEDALHLCQKYLAGYALVSDREAFEAQIFLLERAKIATELAAACTLSAARKMTFKPTDHVVLFLCGSNISFRSLMDYHRQLL